MSWLGSGLSQITGQISTFTKEVLTEGTEEIDDHATELRLAKRRITELETYCIAQKAENDKRNLEIGELTEKLESAELQINAISNEYRGIVQSKEEEIQKLRHQQESEFSHELLSSSEHNGGAASPRLSHSTSAPSLHRAAFDREFVDEDDLDNALSSQRQINELTSTINHLQSQLLHWRNLAESQGKEVHDKGNSSTSVTALKTQVKELEQELQDEVDQHQRQLATLQDVHSQKLATLQKKHQEQVSTLQEQISQLMHSRSSPLASQHSGELRTLRDKCRHLEEAKHKLSVDLDLTHAADREKARQMELLQQKVNTLSDERDKLVQERTSFRKIEADLRHQLDALTEERLNQQAPVSPNSKSGATARRRLPATPVAGTPDQVNELENEVSVLQKQVEALQTCVEELELSQSDWMMEKEALEEVLLKLRQQVQAQKGGGDLDLARGEDERHVSAQTQVLQEQLKQLSRDKESLCREIDESQNKVQHLNDLLGQQQGMSDDYRESSENYRREIEHLSQALTEKENIISSFEIQIADKGTSLADAEEKVFELEALLAEKEADVEKSHHENLHGQYRKIVAERDQEVTRMRGEIQQQGEVMKKLETDVQQFQKLAEEEREMRILREAELERSLEAFRQLESEVDGVREEKDSLEQSLVELDEQHEEAVEHIVAARDKLISTNQEMMRRVDELEAQLKDATTSAADSKEGAAERLKMVEANLTESRMETEELRKVKSLLESEKMELQAKLSKIEGESAALSQKYSEELKSKEMLILQVEEAQVMKSNFETTFSNLESKLASLKDLQASTERERDQARHLCSVLETKLDKAQAEVKSLRGPAASDPEMTAAREQNSQGTLQTASADEQRLNSLQVELQSMSGRMEALQRSNRVTEEELIKTKLGYEAVIAERDKLLREAKQIQDDLTEQLQLKPVMDDLRSENQKLQQNLNLLNEQVTLAATEKQVAENRVTEMCAKVQTLEAEIAERERQLEENEKEVTRLKGVIDDTSSNYKSNEIDSALKCDQNVLELEAKYSQLSLELERAKVLVPHRSKKFLDLDQDIPEELQNGFSSEINCDVLNEDPEVRKLQTQLDEKNATIAELGQKASSLAVLLEEHSQAQHGSKVLLDLHSLEREARNLRLEKEQMMSILNEKTRECSSLKNEVHKLMNVVSQEKAAIMKLQQDNQELVKTTEAPNQDMTKEAIKRLSQIIRDKDLELESLKQKNQTLLHVLQDAGSQDGTTRHLASVIQERDNLTKQVRAFQEDREQIIVALNTKHQESLTYHKEIQRLSALLTENSDEKEKLEREYDNLVQQHDDKQRAFVKVQNELVNFKQKFADLDTKYNEIQNQMSHNASRGSSANDEGETASVSSQEVSDLRTIIQSQEESFAEKDELFREQQLLLEEKSELLYKKDKMLQEKDARVNSLTQRIHASEEESCTWQSQLHASKKQVEHTTFQLQGLQTELDDIRQERKQLCERVSNLQQEMAAHKEAQNQLTMAYNDKEFEVKSLREKAATLTGMLQEKGDADERREETEKLLQELENASRNTQAFKQERDQVLLALQQTQMDNQELKQEMNRTFDRAGKLERECERLRSHLLQIEEGYTAEALQAEEREKDLRNRLALAQQDLLTSSSAVKNANLESSKQVENLQKQLHTLAEQRDQAVLQLATAQDLTQQYATSLANLQMVLEQFQLDKENQSAIEQDRHQRELVSERREKQQLLHDVESLQSQLEETTDALEAAHRLSEQLDRKEEMIAALREEVQIREKQLSSAEEEISKLTSNTEAKVDKLVIKNLVIGYFHTPSNKRSEVLRLIGRVLSFSAQEMQQVGAGEATGGWLGGLMNKVKGSATPPVTPMRGSPNKSFSELFVNFLEKESTPTLTMALPAERMAQEELHRHRHTPNTPTRPQQAFNPFSTAVPPSLNPVTSTPVPDARNQMAGSPHILMNPGLGSSSMPVFVAPASGPQNSSGAGTSSGAILRDVLRQ